MSLIERFGVEFLLPDDEIYLDSATIGKMPASSLQIMNDFYSKQGGGVAKGTHKVAIRASHHLESMRDIISSIFRIDTSQLSFLPSRETAITNAIFALKASKEDNVITSIYEDHSILAPIIRSSKYNGHSIIHLDSKDERKLPDSLQDKITPQTKGVILSALTLGIGVSRNWRKITKVCNDFEVPFIFDISYAVGHQPFNFSTDSPDLVVSSGSFGALGPQGSAFQIVSEKFDKKFDPCLVGAGTIVSLDANNYTLLKRNSKYEPGTINIAAIAGLANSLKILSEVGFEKIQEHETKLREILFQEISSIPQIEVITDDALNFGPILSFVSTNIEAHDIAIILEDISKVLVRSGALCSHLFMKEIKQDSIVQLSTHLYNTEEEIKIFNETLKSIMEEM